MSYQYKIDGTIQLNELGVAVIQAYHALPVDDDIEAPDRWERIASQFPCVAAYVKDNDRSDFIPFGGYGALDPSSKLEGNVWTIECSTADKEGEIEKFRTHLLPAIATAVDMTVEDDDGFEEEFVVKDGRIVTHKVTSRRQREGSNGWF